MEVSRSFDADLVGMMLQCIRCRQYPQLVSPLELSVAQVICQAYIFSLDVTRTQWREQGTQQLQRLPSQSRRSTTTASGGIVCRIEINSAAVIAENMSRAQRRQSGKKRMLQAQSRRCSALAQLLLSAQLARLAPRAAVACTRLRWLFGPHFCYQDLGPRQDVLVRAGVPAVLWVVAVREVAA